MVPTLNSFGGGSLYCWTYLIPQCGLAFLLSLFAFSSAIKGFLKAKIHFQIPLIPDVLSYLRRTLQLKFLILNFKGTHPIQNGLLLLCMIWLCSFLVFSLIFHFFDYLSCVYYRLLHIDLHRIFQDCLMLMLLAGSPRRSGLLCVVQALLIIMDLGTTCEAVSTN